jgi:hypothetical protein
MWARVRHLVAGLGLIALIAAGPQASLAGAVSTVFDNTTTLGPPGGGPTCCRTAEGITLAGDARVITELSIPISTQHTNLIAAVEAGIYLNYGPGGNPGTALWHSGLLDVPLAASATVLNFSVPSVAVPDTISISFWNPSAMPVALERFLPGGPPTIGTLDAVWVETSPDVWVAEVPAFEFAVKVGAIPEPSALALMATGLFGLIAGMQRTSVH